MPRGARHRTDIAPSPPFLLIWATHGAEDLRFCPKLPLGLGFREPQSLQLQGHWGWKRPVKGSTALHQRCSLHTFLIWATHGAGEVQCKPTLFQSETVAPCPVATGLGKKPLSVFLIRPLYIPRGHKLKGLLMFLLR